MVSKHCNPATVLGWGLSALAIQECFRLLNQANDNNFLPNYLRANYNAALTSATAYAYLAYLKDHTEQQFNDRVAIDQNHPLLPELNNMARPPPKTADEYLIETVGHIQRTTTINLPGLIHPDSDNTRGAQWIKLTARGDSPDIAAVLQRIDDLFSTQSHARLRSGRMRMIVGGP